MLSIIRERIRQGHRTAKYPQEAPTLPERFRGRPIIDQEKCPQGCQECIAR
jgi:formate hydrogenlyase subunit 6/NADH:ubiquinone oxidoreductase subunit I